MDRIREARRSSMATTGNGFPRRRHRTIGLRDSSEEGQVELQETVRLRAVSSKRDRDRDFSNKNKRRRGSHREEGDQSTDESVGNEEYEVEDGGISLMVFPNTSLPVSDQNHRRNVPLARPARPAPPPWKIIDEVIGVMVPRKARSASAKRPHDSWVSASVSAEDKNFLQRSNSPERHSAEAASPSSSNVSVRKKMKASGPKTRLPKTTKSPSPAQEDIEIEIAEVLYGLRTSRNQDSSRKLETNDEHDINGDSKGSVPSPIINSQTSILPLSHSPSSYPFMDVEKKKVEDDNSSTMVPKNLSAEVVRSEIEQPSKLETRSSESAKLSGSNDDNATGREDESSKPPKVDKEDNLNSGAGCGGTADERPKSTTKELPSCSKLDVDKHDSTDSRGISAVPEAKSERVEKFEIDLMAPPPMVLSPDRNDFSRADLTSETLALDAELKRENNIQVEDKVEKLVKNGREPEEIKKGTCKEKRDLLKLGMEKPNKDDNDSASSNQLEKQNSNQEQASSLTNRKVEKTAQSGSVPLSTVVPGWPGCLPPLGYMPHLQTVVKADKNTGLPTASPHMNIANFQPQPKKRCAIHHYIARNISFHQQYMKMNQFWPAAVGSGSLHGKLNNADCVASSESMVVGKQTKQNVPGVNQNASQEKSWPVTSFPGLAAHKSSEAANLMDSTQKKQFVLQQGPQPAPAGNLVLDPASLLPMGQPQAPVTTATSQAGGAKSSGNASSSSKSTSTASGSLGTASALPTVAAAMSFSYPNLPVNDASYVAIVQNNGYPFPFSTPLGSTSAIRGGSPAQATPILNGPFYTSQIFHPLQHAQQHSHSNALVRSSYSNTNNSNGSSLSHKQPRGAQVNGSNILTPTTQLQQQQKQHNSLPHHPHKLEAEMGGVNAPSVASQNSYSQKNAYGQNLTIPVQPVNLSFRPSAAPDSTGGNGRNFGENQQQQQASKGGVELIPPQAFAISFAAFNGTSIPSNLNFSSMAQNPMIFHGLPDVAWQGYQAGGSSHTTQQKTCPTSEGKTGGNPSHRDDEKKVTSMKSSNNGPTTLVFDNSSKNLNFMFSPMNGSWPSRSVASTSITPNASLSSNASNSQQAPQLSQHQKQHAMQQQQTPVGTRYNASSANTTSSTKFVNSPPVFSQTLLQCNNSNQASQSKSSRRTPDSQVPHTSIITTAPMLKNFPPEQGRVLQGHTQISFGGNQYSPLPPHGQRVLTSNQPLCTTAAGSPPNGGNLKPNSHGSKAGSSINTLPMQQTENSSAATGQKSSPVCGRNVPSILSSCSSHLSELKY